jgi:predicted NACHT family NTPase
LLGEDQSRPLEKVFVKLNIVEDYQRPPHDAEFLGLMDAKMRTRQRLFSREEQEEEHAMPRARAGKARRTLSPDELLRGNLKAIITGSPGAGKTTLARWLAGQELRHADHLPVFLELKTISARAFDEADGDLAELIFNRELAQPLDLDKAEQQYLSAAFRERLHKGEVTIILDGLDEVSGADYFKRLCAAVNGFNAKYRECRSLITTRPYALQTRFEGLKEMEIAPLNDRQIAEFLDYYYGEQEQWQEFQRELKRRRDLRELARVPVLLGFIVQLWREQGAVGWSFTKRSYRRWWSGWTRRRTSSANSRSLTPTARSSATSSATWPLRACSMTACDAMPNGWSSPASRSEKKRIVPATPKDST